MEYLLLDDYYSEFFRENARIYAELKGITQWDIGRKLGIGGNTICMLLHGQRHKRVDMFIAQAIANILEVDLESLLAPNLLSLDPKIREFLYYPRNQQYTSALMAYLRTNDIQAFEKRIKRIKRKEF